MIRYYLRAMGIVMIVILVAMLGNIIFSFTGNPVYTSTAEKKIQRYVENRFAGMELERSECQYSFTDNTYYIQYQSKNSKDTNFKIYYDVKGDRINTRDYEIKIDKRLNTITRLENQYTAMVKNAIENNYPKEVYKLFEDVRIKLLDTKDKPINQIALDTKLSDIMGYPTELEVKIRTNVDDSFSIALDMKVLHKILENNNIYLKEYNFMFNRLLESRVFLDIEPNTITDKNLVEIVEGLMKRR